MYAHALARAQRAAGLQTDILIPYFDYYAPGGYQEHYTYDGLDVYQYLEPSSPLDRDIIRGRKRPEGIAEFRRILEKLRPDIVHFHELTRSMGLTVEHLKIAKNTGARVLLTMHISGYTCNTGNLIREGVLCDGVIRTYQCSSCCNKAYFKLPGIAASMAAGAGAILLKSGLLEKMPKGRVTTLLSMPASIQRVSRELADISAQTDRIVSLTHWYKRILLQNGVPAEKISVVKQALAAKRNPLTAKDPTPAGLPLRIIFIGRIQPQKGVHLLIDAVSGLPEDQIKLDIFGKAEETDYYRQCRAKSAGSPAIGWMGLLDHDKVVETMTQYHFLCLPSAFSEMSPLVIQEAFAAGIPVLASRVYGNIEQVRDEENGWLFDFNDSRDLRRKLSELIADPSRIDKAKGRLRAGDSFDRVVRDYFSIYETL